MARRMLNASVPAEGGAPAARPATSAGTFDDRLLLHLARGGDHEAFARIVERHDRILRSLAFRLVGGPERMDDVMTAAYVKAYRALPRLSEHVTTHSWLYRIAYTACLDDLRRQWRHARRSTRSAGTDDQDPVEPYLEADGAIGPALDQLPVDQRAAVLLADGHQLDIAEVSDALDVPARLASSLLDAARLRIGSAVSTGSGDSPADSDQPAPAPLDELDVPAHGSGFWDRIGRRLVAERTAPASPPPRSAPEPAPEPVAEPAPAPVPLDPETVGGLTRHADKTNERRPGVEQLLVALVVAVVVIGLVALAVRIGSNAEPPLERQGTVAGEVIDRTIRQMAGFDSLQAEATTTRVDGAGRETQTAYEVLWASDGSYRVAVAGTGRKVVHDSGANVSRVQESNGAVSLTETRGLAAGPPDPNALEGAAPIDDLALALRAVRATPDQLAKPERVGRTAVWALDAELAQAPPGQPDEVRLVLDRRRLLPVEVRLSDDGRLLRRTAYVEVTPDAGLLPGIFGLEPGLGGTVATTDHGFVAVPLAQVPVVVGHEPIRPSYLPDDFELAAVRAKADGAVVSLRYQRGPEHIVVTTRTSPVASGIEWANPYPHFPPGPPTESVRLGGGRFRTVEATRLTDPHLVQSLWGTDGRLAFTVSGHLTPTELVRVAESLR